MIRDARSDHGVIRRASQEALKAWFRQSERLNVARRHYRLHGARFLDFARRLGISNHTTAYALVHLHQHRLKIISKCINDAEIAARRGQVFHYPGWETALGWFHKSTRAQETGRFWLTPPSLYAKLDAEFGFDFDPCPHPLPKGHNALTMEWGQTNYLNPPFAQNDVVGGYGATAFVRKAIVEQQKGKTSVIVLPCHEYITKLLLAGAEIRPLGRVPFRDVDSNRPSRSPANVACFVLRGRRP